MTTPPTRFRLGVLAIVVLSLFCALFARLWYLQVLTAPELTVQAESNRIRTLPEPPLRGRILDAKGRVIVDNRLEGVVELSPEVARDLKARTPLLQKLSPLLGVEVATLDARATSDRVSPFAPVPIAREVPMDTVVQLRERAAEFPGVTATQVAERYYPQGTTLAHVVGYVGEISAEELDARKDDGYVPGDQIGKTGLERLFEKDLRGQAGQARLEVDVNGDVVRQVSETPPVQGSDIVLTIDLDVQQYTERTLAEGLASAHQTKSQDPSRKNQTLPATAGSVTVLDPRNGSVVAMASNPTYSPQEFVGGISNADFANLQSEEAGAPLNNRATQGLYAPGSTFKLVTALASLRSGLITPNTPYRDTGELVVKDCTGACTFKNPGGTAYGVLTLPRALTISSDVFFYHLGEDLWLSRNKAGFSERTLQDAAVSLGYGSPTGIALPDEAAGRVPDRASKAKLHEQNPTAFPFGDWTTGNSILLAIGQGELVVTPLQIANAYGTLANGGTRYSPNLVAKVLRPDGTLVRDLAPRVAGTTDLPDAFRDPILEGLQGAVADPRGTAYAAFQGFPLDAFPVSGKTGTAQVDGKEDTSLFVGFGGPAGAPAQYTVATVIEEGGFGSQVAAPITRRIFDGLAGVYTLAPGGDPNAVAPPPLTLGDGIQD